MKMALSLILLSAALFLGFRFLALPVSGEDGDYLARMTGCTDCSSCKKRVVMAFADLEGVTMVRFLKEKENDLHKVLVGTDGKEISFEVVASALKDLHHFELESWDLLKKN